MNKIAVIGVPRAGARRVGQEGAPQSFRQAALIERLRASGLHVDDFGRFESVSFLPDTENPESRIYFSCAMSLRE